MVSKVPALFAHQQRSIEFFNSTAVGADLSSPGTGKTRVQIEWYAAHRARGGKRALIIAPKSLLQTAWGNDFDKFAPQLTYSVATASNRKKALSMPADVIITNIDAAKVLVEQPASWFRSFDTLIIDESTSLKHHTAQRSRAVAKIVKHFKYRHILTGTPNSNGVTDLWHQFFLLDDGKRLGKTFFGFRNATCESVQTGPAANMVRWQDKPGIEDQVFLLLNDIVIRHKFEECVDIPANHLYPLYVDLNKDHRELYDELKQDSLLVLQNSTVSAVNGAALYTKLLQLASGSVYSDDENYAPVDTDRYELIIELIKERAARAPSVVFFQYRHQKEELTKLAEKNELSWAVIDGSTSDKDRVDVVEHFQKGFYDALFTHPQSAGHGLTLTRARTTIWASPTYNLEHFLQGNRRIYRIGQKDKTETIVILAKDTVDEKVYEALENKNVKLTALLELLKEK